MAKPTINVNIPIDGEEIGQGAQRIRETRQAIYDLLPINPEDLNYDVEGNWWPAGSLTGGMDPEVVDETKNPYSGMQDRAFLIGDTELKFDYSIPSGKNAISPGPLEIGDVTVTVPTGSTWTVVGEEDLEVQYLRDLADVEVGGAITDQDALLWHNDEGVWKPGPAPEGPPGPPGPGFNFEGTVPTKEDIPGWPDSYSGKVGDVYVTENTNHIWAWSGNEWYDVGPMSQNGKGWTGGSYNSANGITTFTSDDGLGFSTTDIRGAKGDKGDKGDPGDPFDPSGDYTVTGTWQFTQETSLPIKNSYLQDIVVTHLDNNVNTQDRDLSILALDGTTSYDGYTGMKPARVNAITANPATGKVVATKFQGDGSELTNLPSSGVQLDNTAPWQTAQYNAISTPTPGGGGVRINWNPNIIPVIYASSGSGLCQMIPVSPFGVNGSYMTVVYSGGNGTTFLYDESVMSGDIPEVGDEDVHVVYRSHSNKWIVA